MAPGIDPGGTMQRREFMTLLGCAAIIWPRAARSQQPGVPVIGYLTTGSPDDLNSEIAAAFDRGLAESGYLVGRNVKIERRWAGGNYDRLPEFVLELVRLNPALIVVGGNVGCARRKARYFNHSHNIQHCVRPGEARAGKKLRSPRRQRHRHSFDDSDAYPQAS